MALSWLCCSLGSVPFDVGLKPRCRSTQPRLCRGCGALQALLRQAEVPWWEERQIQGKQSTEFQPEFHGRARTAAFICQPARASPPLEFVLTEMQTLAQVPLGSALPAARFKAFLEKERGPRPSYRDL